MQGSKEQFLLYRLRVYKDPRAFAEIFNRHKPPVYRYLCTKLPSRQDAEDALSTTFLRLWNYVTASPVDHVASLTFTIAKGVVADFYRKRKDEVSLDDQYNDIEGEEDVEKDAQVQINIRILKKALPTLSDDYQDIVILRYLQGLSTREVASYLQKTESAVRVGLHRALKELRSFFENEQSHEGKRNRTTSKKP